LVFEIWTCSALACCSTSPPTFSLVVTKALTSWSRILSKSAIAAGRGSAGGTEAGRAVVEESGGAAAELDIAATVDGWDESMDVAMSSSLDVAASSLWYITVSLALGTAIGFSDAMISTAREIHSNLGIIQSYLLIRVVRLCILVFAAMVAAALVRTREFTVVRKGAETGPPL
jgi:hypothetical protein